MWLCPTLHVAVPHAACGCAPCTRVLAHRHTCALTCALVRPLPAACACGSRALCMCLNVRARLRKQLAAP
eukprot:3479391-Pleurochrysis_carterae.AAC.4